MEFRKYNSIENAYQEKFIEKIIFEGFADEEFVVQEKVHGANLSFITDGKEIKVAKRTGFIEEDDDFYNYKIVLEKYRNNILELFNELKKSENISLLRIYGELFGGTYPHKEVARNRNAVAVQKGVFYAPDNDFFAFDLMIDGVFLEIEKANQLFEKFGFFYAKTMFKGKLTDCLTQPVDFVTKIPEQLGLPQIEGNITEGIVIKPNKPLFLRNGSRVLIKSKNEKFSEKKKRSSTSKEVFEIKISEELQFLMNELLQYINENRLQNVISKIGTINPQKDFGKLTGLFNQDILEDFMKDFEEEINQLEKEDFRFLKKRMNGESSKIIKKLIFEENLF